MTAGESRGARIGLLGQARSPQDPEVRAVAPHRLPGLTFLGHFCWAGNGVRQGDRPPQPTRQPEHLAAVHPFPGRPPCRGAKPAASLLPEERWWPETHGLLQSGLSSASQVVMFCPFSPRKRTFPEAEVSTHSAPHARDLPSSEHGPAVVARKGLRACNSRPNPPAAP